MSLAMTEAERHAFLADLHVGVISIEQSERPPLTVLSRAAERHTLSSCLRRSFIRPDPLTLRATTLWLMLFLRGTQPRV